MRRRQESDHKVFRQRRGSRGGVKQVIQKVCAQLVIDSIVTVRLARPGLHRWSLLTQRATGGGGTGRCELGVLRCGCPHHAGRELSWPSPERAPRRVTFQQGTIRVSQTTDSFQQTIRCLRSCSLTYPRQPGRTRSGSAHTQLLSTLRT